MELTLFCHYWTDPKKAAITGSDGVFMRFKRFCKLTGMAALGMTAYLSGCATPPPSNVANACAIFKENKTWYRQMKRAEKRWGMPIHIQLAIMRQESAFVHDAKPARKKILWVIPGPRPSSSYGYSQAQTTTWEWYKSEGGRRGADRNDFDDAADFIAWYGSKSRELSGISLWDPTINTLPTTKDTAALIGKPSRKRNGCMQSRRRLMPMPKPTARSYPNVKINSIVASEYSEPAQALIYTTTVLSPV